MKKVYMAPETDYIEVIERYGVLEKENCGVAGGEISYGKENDFTWNDNVNDLWGDESEEEK